MAQHVAWYDDERTIALMVFEGRWTWEDFFEARSAIHRLLDEVEHEVQVIADFTTANGMPIGGSAFSLARNSLENSRPNMGLVVICGANRLVDSMVKMFTKVFSGSIGKRIRSVENMQSAVELIEKEKKPDTVAKS